MKFGRGSASRGIDEMIEVARLAETHGFDLCTIGDSQSRARELYTTLSVVAHETETITVGPLVTNPVTRHPAVTASAICTLAEHAPDRVFLGIGSGDSAVYTLGKRPASLSDIEESVRFLRRLSRGESAQYEGETVELNWLAESEHSVDVPIAMAAEGPKTLRLAGQIADRVFVGLGIEPEIIETSVEYITEGANAADRNPENIDIWFVVDANVRDDTERAIDEIKMSLGSFAHHSLQFTMDGKEVPDEYVDRLKTLVEQYDPNEHGKPGETNNRRLVEELGLTGYLADRYAVAGTPDDCVETLREIKATGHADGVLFAIHAKRDREITRRLGEEVFPYV